MQEANGLPDTPDACAENLTALLERQFAHYEGVRDLARRQTEAIAGKNTETLIHLLTEKQKHIAAIDALAAEVRPLQAVCETHRETLSAPVRAALEEAVDALRAVLEEIVALEDEGQRELGQSRQHAGNEMRKLQRGKAAHKAYGLPKPSGPSRYKDKNG